jgi:adenine-specific DNA-methyltransferase
MPDRQQQLTNLLYDLLPPDGSAVGNTTLLSRLQAAGQPHGLTVDEAEYYSLRDALVASGKAVKGRGRGGSTARTLSLASVESPTSLPAAEPRPEFTLAIQEVPPELPFDDKPAAPRKQTPKPTPSVPGDPQVLSYRHPDRRVNNPEVGLVSEQTDPETPKTTWAYDPHLDPDLRFDPSGAKVERLIDDALAAGVSDPEAMKAALEELKRMGSPHLQWAGKAERTNFQVDTVSLHVHERIDPMSILAELCRAYCWY